MEDTKIISKEKVSDSFYNVNSKIKHKYLHAFFDEYFLFFRQKKKKQKSCLLVGLLHLSPSRFCASSLGPKRSDKSSRFPQMNVARRQAWSRRCKNPYTAIHLNFLDFLSFNFRVHVFIAFACSCW
jgi:hypothetical protein